MPIRSTIFAVCGDPIATISAAGRKERERGLQRRPVAYALQVEHHHELEADVAAEERDHTQVGPPQRAAPQDAQPQQWVLGVAFDQDERGGQCGGDDQAGDRTHRRPARLRRADHGEHQQHRGRDAKDRAGYVVSATVLLRPRAARDQPVRREQRVATAIGNGSRKVQRQPTWVITPEKTRPRE
nr:hypothetical protein [Fodinicola feengrottensis]